MNHFTILYFIDSVQVNVLKQFTTLSISNQQSFNQPFKIYSTHQFNLFETFARNPPTTIAICNSCIVQHNTSLLVADQHIDGTISLLLHLCNLCTPIGYSPQHRHGVHIAQSTPRRQSARVHAKCDKSIHAHAHAIRCEAKVIIYDERTAGWPSLTYAIIMLSYFRLVPRRGRLSYTPQDWSRPEIAMRIFFGFFAIRRPIIMQFRIESAYVYGRF